MSYLRLNFLPIAISSTKAEHALCDRELNKQKGEVDVMGNLDARLKDGMRGVVAAFLQTLLPLFLSKAESHPS